METKKMNSLGERVKKSLQASGKSQGELSRYLGLTPGSVSLWVSGKTKNIKSSHIYRAAEFLGVSPVWVATGKVDVESSKVGSVPDGILPNGYVAIPQYRIRFGAGREVPPTYDEETDSRPVLYEETWFQVHHVSPKNCRRFTIRGESMWPLIYDGDYVMCDCSPVDHILPGKVYVFCFEGELFCKRLYRKASGEIILKSENPDYAEETIKPNDTFFIVGRVIDLQSSKRF